MFFQCCLCQCHLNRMGQPYIIIIMQHHNHIFISIFRRIQFTVHLNTVLFGISIFQQRIIIQYVFRNNQLSQKFNIQIKQWCFEWVIGISLIGECPIDESLIGEISEPPLNCGSPIGDSIESLLKQVRWTFASYLRTS